jgi:hypothetical protein
LNICLSVTILAALNAQRTAHAGARQTLNASTCGFTSHQENILNLVLDGKEFGNRSRLPQMAPLGRLDQKIIWSDENAANNGGDKNEGSRKQRDMKSRLHLLA